MSALFDAVGPSAAGQLGGGTPTTWSHTCSGSDRALFVAIAAGTPFVDTDIVVSGVTYNGVAMSFIGRRHSNDNTLGYVELWVLANPASGTNTVSVALSSFASGQIECGSTSCTGVDQTTPYDGLVSAVGASTAPSVNVASAVGNLALDAACCGAAFSASGQTLRWNLDVNTESAGGNGAGSTAAGAASVTMSYTTGNDWWAILGVNVRAAGGGGDTNARLIGGDLVGAGLLMGPRLVQ